MVTLMAENVVNVVRRDGKELDSSGAVGGGLRGKKSVGEGCLSTVDKNAEREGREVGVRVTINVSVSLSLVGPGFG